ncbi:hypothetical protein MAR_038215, partial [Mya arenaria]
LKRSCVSKWSLDVGCLGKCKPGYFGQYCEETCSKECLKKACNKSSGICKDCTRTYLEGCTQECGQGCREKDGFPRCDRKSGKCLNGCVFNHYGNFCNVSCRNCKRNSSVVLCDSNGVCLYGCENGYWDKKCNSKCSANCESNAYENRCNSSTGECLNGCTRGWSGLFCGDTMEERHYICEQDNMNEVNPRRSVVESDSSIELNAARKSKKEEGLFGDLGQFQVDYIHAIAREESDNKLGQHTMESPL